MLDGVPALILRSTQGCLMLGMGRRSLSQEKDILLTALLEKDQEPGSRNQLCPPNLRFVRRRADDNTASVLSQRLEIFITDNRCHCHMLRKKHHLRALHTAVRLSGFQVGRVPIVILPGHFAEWPALPNHPTPGHSTHAKSAHKYHLLREAVLVAPHYAHTGIMSSHVLCDL